MLPPIDDKKHLSIWAVMRPSDILNPADLTGLFPVCRSEPSHEPLQLLKLARYVLPSFATATCTLGTFQKPAGIALTMMYSLASRVVRSALPKTGVCGKYQ